MVSDALLIAGGFVLLVIGGELLVRGAVDLAERLKMSAFIIGAVVIGFGSSTPELVTSIEAGLRGAPGIAIGNIVGSNIINVLVVIGIASVIAPISLSGENIRFDTIIVCVFSAVFVAICSALELTPLIGAVFLIVLAGYLTYSIRGGMIAANASTDDPRPEPSRGNGGIAATAAPSSIRSLAIASASIVVGFAILILGGHLVVASAVAMAGQMGLSQSVIGLTVVAFGTSLPEIVTAVIAAYRRHADVALGNVLGSCVFNLLAIGGAIAILTPGDVPQEIVRFDNFVMLAAAVLLLFAVSFSRTISRPVGAAFLGSYATYLVFIWP